MAMKRTGFIQNVSPQKKGKGPEAHFWFTVQTSPDKGEKVLGFGDGQHKIITNHELKQSPVQMSVRKNEKYKSLIFNNTCSCTNVSTHDVTFPFNKLVQGFETLSKSIEISALANCTPDNNYLTVKGKVLFGSNDPKILDENRIVKEDIVIKDQKSSIALHIWKPLLSDITSLESYELTHLKLKQYYGEKYLTTTYSTKYSKIAPIDVDFEESECSPIMSIAVSRFECIGEVQKFYSCCKCKKKITLNEFHKKFVKCENCKCMVRFNELSKHVFAELTIANNDEEIKVTASTEILATIVNVNQTGDEIAEALLELTNLSLTYNSKTMMVSELKMEDEKEDEEMFEENDTETIKK